MTVGELRKALETFDAAQEVVVRIVTSTPICISTSRLEVYAATMGQRPDPKPIVCCLDMAPGEWHS